MSNDDNIKINKVAKVNQKTDHFYINLFSHIYQNH